MDMQQVHFFLTVSDTLNFTQAAEICDVSQPTLTRAVKAIETELGGDLLRREGKNTHLTDLGERMLPFLRRSYENALMAKEVARAVAGHEITPLTLAVSHSVSIELFLDPIAELYSRFSGLQLRIEHGSARTVMESLKDGRADFALAGPIESGWSRLEKWGLFEERLSAAVPRNHPLSDRKAIKPAELRGIPLFLYVGCELKDRIVAWLEEALGDFKGANVIDQSAGLAKLLLSTGGAAILPLSTPIAPELKRIAVETLELKREVSAFSVAGRPRSISASTFLSQIRAYEFSRAHLRETDA